MKILLDHCVPKRLRNRLPNHEVKTASEMGWDAYKNGRLLSAAEGASFPVLLTVDKNMMHQQNMAGRQIAIVVLWSFSNRIEDLIPLIPLLETALAIIQPGQVVKVELPPGSPR